MQVLGGVLLLFWNRKKGMVKIKKKNKKLVIFYFILKIYKFTLKSVGKQICFYVFFSF